MHINRKTGEQVEVDWVDNPGHITDLDTDEIINAYLFVGVIMYNQHPYAEAFIDEKQLLFIPVRMYRCSRGTETANPVAGYR